MPDLFDPRRRALLRTGFALPAGVALLPLGALAQSDYPTRPIRILIGTPPGDTADASARQLAGRLSALLGQTVFVENKPGGHGMIVGSAAKAADKDGYTLLMSSSGPMTINPSLYGKRLSYDPLKDFDPIAQVSRNPLYLYCNNGVPVTNVKEMVAWVKAQKGKVSYGSGGSGTTQHLSMELLKKLTGMEMTHVPYRGSPMVLQDVIGGQIPFAFDAGASLLPQARSGKVRLLGMTGARRSTSAPEVPTMTEQGIAGFEVYAWIGLFAPAGTPAAVVARLGEAVGQVVRSTEFTGFLASTSGEPPTGTSEDFRKLVAGDIARWAVIVKESGAQPD